MTDPIITAYFSKLGKRSLQTMTPEARKERARKAVKARWDRKNKST